MVHRCYCDGNGDKGRQQRRYVREMEDEDGKIGGCENGWRGVKREWGFNFKG